MVVNVLLVWIWTKMAMKTVIAPWQLVSKVLLVKMSQVASFSYIHKMDRDQINIGNYGIIKVKLILN